ncbi:MAG: hypothetical protein H0W99_01805 [Acidobacteria bacterium]|nr:hypothetical protein [Acidobacteriota bacterium]
MKKKRNTETHILNPNEHSEYWDVILEMRDTGDPRWKELSPGLRYTAEMYEKNLKKPVDGAAQ